MNNKRLEERINMLETDVACIRETNKEFFDMHKSEEEINQYHIELFNDIVQHIDWLSGAITLLSFTTAGLLIGLIGSHAKIAALKKMMNEGYLDDPTQAENVSTALKIPINSVYGLTAASFENPFRDPRNANNIVALRGALFMRTLQDEVINRGFQIVAIKTDSIKIADATPEIIKFCFEFAAKYGYAFL